MVRERCYKLHLKYGTESQSLQGLIRAPITYIQPTARRHFLSRGATPDDIRNAKALNHHVLYFCTNGVPPTEARRNVEEEPSFIKLCFRLGYRMMHLTYNRRNLIGDGCAEPSDAGLNDFVRTVIRELNGIGIIIDLAHAIQRTSLEATIASAHPIIASHTSASFALSCKFDEVLCAIVKKNGVVGVYAMGDFSRPSRYLNAMLDHIDYIEKWVGVDHVAICTDLAYEAADFQHNFARLPVCPRGKASTCYVKIELEEWFGSPFILFGLSACTSTS
jgi:membrane dipeptidase